MGVQSLILNSQRATVTRSTLWGRAVWTALLATFVLAVYPERLIQRTDTHLLTVVIGALVLFAPMRVMLTSLVPCEREEISGKLLISWHRWGIVVVVGVLIGAFAFVGEMGEGVSQLPMSRLLFVAPVFVALGLASTPHGVDFYIADSVLAAQMGVKGAFDPHFPNVVSHLELFF